MIGIGIDIGTTTLSGVAVDLDSRKVKRSRTVENGSFLPAEHPWERMQDPEIIVKKARAMLEELLDGEQACAIGLTGQMHGMVYVDREGRAAGPLYTWQDSRGELPEPDGKSLCASLRERGIPAAAGYGLVTHLYNLRHGLVPSQAASLCTIGDYIGLALTGRKRPLLHQSQAASLGCYDSVRRDFFRDQLAEWGMDLSLLPPVTGALDSLGTFREIPIFVSLGDNQASFLGSVRDASRTVLVNVGTGAQISLLFPCTERSQTLEVRPFLGDSCLLVGSTLCGGAAYAALEGFFREYAKAAGAPEGPQYSVMARLLEEDFHAWKVRTTFLGTRSHPEETGGVEGITLDNFHPAAFIRGVLEGMAEELFQLYDAVCREKGCARQILRVSGNGVRRNPALRDILRRRFSMELQVVEDSEEAALGAALAALGAAGVLSLSGLLDMD